MSYKNQHWDGPEIRGKHFQFAEVYRRAGSEGMLTDTTNGGITCYMDETWLISLELAEGEGDWSPDTLVLVKFPDSQKVIAVPYGYHDKHHVYTKPGGNFIYSTDSRFPMPYPVEVRDRLEGQTIIRVCQNFGETELSQVVGCMTQNHYERDNYLCALAKHARLKPGYFKAQICERNDLINWNGLVVVEEKEVILENYEQ
ncbi:hypothetical protein [Endozoicomonas sp. ALC066]|uniref:hypothetical protein n=1 Tax=Endozoicomonas sp. ALC066 TaxID=3403078 RepID=UPI003BB7A100